LGKQKVEAVKGVSFDIEKGEFAAISGPSGSGKSTILNMVGLIDVPTSGKLFIDDIDVYEGYDLSTTSIDAGRLNNFVEKKDPKIKEKLPSGIDLKITGLRRSHLGFIFQTFNLIPVLNVYENIEFPLLLKSKNRKYESPVDKFSRKEKEDWINFLMEKVGLVDWKKHKPSELSGGQRQRVAIARALVTKAPVILADEPTANLDSVNSAQILSLMKQLNKELNTTFIFSTHDSRIVDMCNHVISIFDGNIKSDEHKTGSDEYKMESR
jgi:putative ABC transport system ATP-binding protein